MRCIHVVSGPTLSIPESLSISNRSTAIAGTEVSLSHRYLRSGVCLSTGVRSETLVRFKVWASAGHNSPPLFGP
jgi:hypothetical protein